MEWQREETPDGITWRYRLAQFGGTIPAAPPVEPGFTRQPIEGDLAPDASGTFVITDTRIIEE
jgi:hypothetical protein